MHLCSSTWTLNTFMPASPRDGQVVHAVDLHVVLEPDFAFLRRDAQVRQALKEEREHDLKLEARQDLTEALVNAKPEGDVAPRVAVHVEPVRIREYRGI